jgi:hypothetical protein
VKLTIRFTVVPRLRKRGVMPSSPVQGHSTLCFLPGRVEENKKQKIG